MLDLCAQAYAEAQSFQLGDRIYHADDHVVGQYYIALAEHFNLSEAVVPVTTTFEEILSNPSSVDLNHSVPGKLYISLNQLLHLYRCRMRLFAKGCLIGHTMDSNLL
jgi:hypothetical protein